MLRAVCLTCVAMTVLRKSREFEGTKLCYLGLFSDILPVQSYYAAALSYGRATARWLGLLSNSQAEEYVSEEEGEKRGGRGANAS